jgi:hypothetical protein
MTAIAVEHESQPTNGHWSYHSVPAIVKGFLHTINLVYKVKSDQMSRLR